MKHLFSTLVLAMFWAMFPLATMADTIPVGDIEFNNLSLGVNDFTVNNFTGANNLGFFPVATNVTFDNVVLLATESNSTVLTFDLGNLAPGTDTSAQVADSLLFTQVVFSATTNDASNHGLGLAIAAGTVTITATDGSVSGTATLTVQ
ncbi:MAG TPA: hypothetical protein VKO18_13365 [Terriglobia bacterium]|nr:hypothetical protein [Terriglobia bacterium]